MSLTTRTRVLKAHQRLCDAIKAAEREHGAPLVVYVGDGVPHLCDFQRFEEQVAEPFEEGGCIVLELPRDGTTWDGGGW